jgi:nitric oxide reductase large subunit
VLNVYSHSAGAGAAGALLGNSLAAHAHGPIGEAAQSVLPFTGIAVGMYLITGIALVVAGVVLRWTSRKRGEAR